MNGGEIKIKIKSMSKSKIGGSNFIRRFQYHGYLAALPQ